MYVKLFSSIYQGTLRGNSRGLLVFTNLLAHADREGFVDIHPRAISEECGLPVDEVRQALLMLEQPDPESRTSEFEGRRITRIDEHRAWGWQVVNYVKYREIRNEHDRREQNRAAQKRFRDKRKADSKRLADSKQSKPGSAHADADADALKDMAEKTSFSTWYEVYPKKVKRKEAETAWKRLKPAERKSAIEALPSFIDSDAWTKDGGKFIPYPASWLNARRWEDEPQDLLGNVSHMAQFKGRLCV